MKMVTVVGSVSHAKGKPIQPRLLSLPQMLDQTVRQHGDRTAVRFYETEISYRKLQDLSRLVAGALRRLESKRGIVSG